MAAAHLIGTTRGNVWTKVALTPVGCPSHVKCRALFLLAAGIAIASPSFGEDPARPCISQQSSFGRIAGHVFQLENERFYGNGFFVGHSGCYVLTNFHVAFGTSKNEKTGEIEILDDPIVGHKVQFYYALDVQSGRFTKGTKATVVEFGNYESGTTRGLVGDIALLRLDECAGSGYSGPELDRPPRTKRTPTGPLTTYTILRGNDGRNELLVEEGCLGFDKTPVTGLFLSVCKAKPGMSGSMVLEQQTGGRGFRLVGMTTKMSRLDDGTHVSIAIYSATLSPFLEKYVDEQCHRPVRTIE